MNDARRLNVHRLVQARSAQNVSNGIKAGASHIAQRGKTPAHLLAVVQMMGDTSVATVNRHYFKMEPELMRELVLGWKQPDVDALDRIGRAFRRRTGAHLRHAARSRQLSRRTSRRHHSAMRLRHASPLTRGTARVLRTLLSALAARSSVEHSRENWQLCSVWSLTLRVSNFSKPAARNTQAAEVAAHQVLSLAGADGARTRDLRRDRPGS